MPKKVLYASPIQLAERKIGDRLPWLVDQLLSLAEGVHIQQVTKDGVQLVYQEKPDRQAAIYLMDRILGRPTQPVSLNTTVREMAAAAGLSDKETEEAIAEAEQLVAMALR